MTPTRLWAPWRAPYLSAIRRSGARCFLCQAARASRGEDRARLVVERTGHVFVVLNRYPYSNGHLMIAPYRHTARLSALSSEASAELLSVADRMMRRLTRVLHPDGFNVGVNLGRAAGAGVPGHLHLHVVPRWIGDTNFMPVLSGTKVISQSLAALYQRVATSGRRR